MTDQAPSAPDTMPKVPEMWREFFADRSVAFVEIARRSTADPPYIEFLYTLLLSTTWGALVLLASIMIGVSSERWWLGALVFVILLALTAIIMTAVRGDSVTRRKIAERTRARETSDPIGKLLPPFGCSLKEIDNPASYAGLFALHPRPALVIDVEALGRMDPVVHAKPLAPRGRFPEPEFVDINPLFAELGPRGVPTADLLIGAGWLRDPMGEIWTVDDSVLVISTVRARVRKRKRRDAMVTTVQIRLVKPTAVREINIQTERPFFKRSGSGSADSAGADSRALSTAEFDMPTATEPLRLLLSSWTYPEPRTDLAMRD